MKGGEEANVQRDDLCLKDVRPSTRGSCKSRRQPSRKRLRSARLHSGRESNFQTLKKQIFEENINS